MTKTNNNKRKSARPASAGRRPSKKALEMRKRRRRRRRIRNTILLILVLAALIAAGFGIIYLLRGGNIETLEFSYSMDREFANTLADKESLRADTFAENLCVVTEDVTIDTASLIDTQAGVLFDVDDKEVMYSLGAYRQVYPASITKLMTAMLAFKYADMNQVVTITYDDINLDSDSQVVGFWEGDQVTMEALVNCLIVYSGNDAAMAIARTIGGGSIDTFVQMMNQYAHDLGCTGTNFVNPHGLHDENHYTTPYDIYLMLTEAFRYPEFSQIAPLGSYTVTYTHADGTEAAQSLLATDQFLTGEATAPKDVTVLGGKTGTTDPAGHCLALMSQNAFGKPYVSIVMGASSEEVLYQQMNSLLQNINSEN